MSSVFFAIKALVNSSEKFKFESSEKYRKFTMSDTCDWRYLVWNDDKINFISPILLEVLIRHGCDSQQVVMLMSDGIIDNMTMTEDELKRMYSVFCFNTE